MKYNKVAIAVISTFLLPTASNAETIYKSIVHKNEYEVKEATLIPGKEVGINITASNTTTGQSDSSDITQSSANLHVENGDFVEINSNIADNSTDGRNLVGSWESTRSLSFLSNDKNESIFQAPNFDGTYYIDLNLNDGKYTKSYRALKVTSEYWVSATPSYTEWTVYNTDQDWSPDLDLSYENELITQTKITDLSRDRQEREERTSTGQFRNVGSPVLETLDNQEETRDEYGTMEYWISTDPIVVSAWGFSEVLVDWNPTTADKLETETISQSREIQNERTMQDQEIRPKTNDIRNVGVPYFENDSLLEYRDVQGDLEHWIPTDSVIISDWAFDQVLIDWNPTSSDKYETETISQSRQIQNIRTVQDKEIRVINDDVRNDGVPYTETSQENENRSVQGDLEYWEETSPLIIADWAVTDVFVDWTPSASGVYENEMVSQYREVKKERTMQEQEFRPYTGDFRVVGSSYKDTSLVNEYRDIQGELEYWENTGTPVCTSWTLDRYDPWLPDASGFDKGVNVEQERIKYESRECTGEQVRPATGDTRSADSEIEYRNETETQTVEGTKIDLTSWSNNDSNGDWSVSNDGSYAYQAINGNSTVFESAAGTYGNSVISGKIRVRDTAGDDDFIGVVFGKTDSNNFLLWSWKRNTQAINGGSSNEGHALAKVTGGVGAVNWFMDVSKAGYTVLDSDISTTNGWNHGVYYDFEIVYTPTNVVVKLDGTTILSSSGSFDSGKIGFFNLSQGQVEYYKVTETPIN